MSRIANAYASKFRTLLEQLHARRPDQGVDWFLHRAEQLSQSEHLTPAQALARLYTRVLLHTHHVTSQSGTQHAARSSTNPLFLCDAGLGGLARWLRAAGYESLWIPDITDDDLLREAAQRHALILTTDSMLMERRVLRDRHLPALWVPPTLTMLEQLELVLTELGLEPRESRCMNCGGELREVPKESVRDRIPPRTLRWRDDYYECTRCGKLYWHGTHWQKIMSRMEHLH